VSCSAEDVVWVSIHNDADLKRRFLDFAREANLRPYPFGPRSIGPDHYEGGFIHDDSSAIKAWFARWGRASTP